MRNPLRRVTKQANTPPVIAQAMTAQGMDAVTPFSPGRPLTPAWGYSQRPRTVDYPVGVNINLRNRQAWGRASFDTLRAMFDAYDIARICGNHKIDELRSMEPLYTPIDTVHTDVDTAVDAAKAVMAYPDRELPYDAWLGKLMENALRFDAPALYRRRNMNGDLIALEVVDGSTLFPLVDGRGRRPAPPAPAWQQVIKGMATVEFTSDDVEYVPFRPQPGSPFGLAPLESILITANTDLRFQWHFLQIFTDGTVPGGFMEVPPDVSSPDQVAEWQDYWDAMVQGDQSILHRLFAVPAGSKFSETRPSTFDSNFPEYLMTRTCAAFGVVPQDLGIIKDVNRATADTQVDIQFRVNTLPWVRWLEGIVNRWLQHDLGLPVQMRLDTGRDKEDRLTEANAWKVYVEAGAASPDEMRAELLGLPVDNERPTPRFILSTRTGPIPLRSLYAIAGAVDPDTLAPADDVPLDTAPYAGAEGVMPDKLPGGAVFHRAPVDPDDPERPGLEQPVPGTDVVTPPVAKGADERAAFARFAKSRARAGKWRDFQFTDLDPREARALNKTARALVRKDTGQCVAAGLAVQAQDTGRVLLIQRGPDPTDPNSGLWEFPGGHLEDGETPMQGAYREWQEETGALLPYVPWEPHQGWVSEDGVYRGFVWLVADETVCVPGRGTVTNPDDPDGDIVEATAWWDPALLPGNPAIRPELQASIGDVLAALTGGEDDEVVKADPKGHWRDDPPDKQPQHDYDLRITDHYRPLIEGAIAAGVPASQLRQAVEQAVQTGDPVAAAGIVQALVTPDTADLDQVIRQVLADAYLAGAHAAAVQVGPAAVTLTGVDAMDWDRWEPGNPAAAGLVEDGGLQQLLEQAGVTVRGVAATTLERVGDGIGDGLRAGHSVGRIGRDLRSVIRDPDRAEMIAHTETARAITQASLATYRANGASEWDWIISAGACPICVAGAAANPHQVSDSDSPPAHPRCRCAAAPLPPQRP